VKKEETALRTTMFTQRNKNYGLGEMTVVASSEAGYFKGFCLFGPCPRQGGSRFRCP
jgi:hypothetical protein